MTSEEQVLSVPASPETPPMSEGTPSLPDESSHHILGAPKTILAGAVVAAAAACANANRAAAACEKRLSSVLKELADVSEEANVAACASAEVHETAVRANTAEMAARLVLEEAWLWRAEAERLGDSSVQEAQAGQEVFQRRLVHKRLRHLGSLALMLMQTRDCRSEHNPGNRDAGLPSYVEDIDDT